MEVTNDKSSRARSRLDFNDLGRLRAGFKSNPSLAVEDCWALAPGELFKLAPHNDQGMGEGWEGLGETDFTEFYHFRGLMGGG